MSELEGLRVLLVEDDGLVAMMVESMLEELGCVVVDVIGSVAKALERTAEGGFDVALLDVTLSDGDVYPVAEQLMTASVPFVFASGYGESALPERFRQVTVAPKPFHLAQLATALATAGKRKLEVGG